MRRDVHPPDRKNGTEGQGFHRTIADRGDSRHHVVLLRRWAVGSLVLILTVFAMTQRPLGGPAGASGPSWGVYHGDLAGSGVAALGSVNTSRRAWTSPVLSGQLYGEPLVVGGLVFVATERDVVYALSGANGRVVWSRHLGTPIPSSALTCGNISPSVGITGTPVVDVGHGELFVVADELVAGRPRHRLIGLSVRTGATEMNVGVDPPGSDPAALLQRTGLTLDAGRVVFGMGGNYGDCGSYRGRVVAVAEHGSRPIYYTVDAASGEREGAIWMGGAAPVIDASNNIWVSVGNGSSTSASSPYDHSDAVLELSSSLRLKQYFAPSTWPQDNANDADLSMSPALLANGQVVVSGKSRFVYLLNAANLGGIGGEETSLPSVCSNDVDGGGAVMGSTVFLPCLSGPVAVRVTASPPSVSVLWTAGAGGGPPIVAAGLVWTIGSDGTLYALDPSTGSVQRRANVGVAANHFATPGVGDGLLLVATTNHVIAFRATN
jgi:outer membrane protein assembly factor BamB